MRHENDRHAESVGLTRERGGAAEALERRAGASWMLARDCDRWGLAPDAEEARDVALGLRVAAILLRATEAAERTRPSGD